MDLEGGSFLTNTMSNNPKHMVLFYVLCAVLGVHFMRCHIRNKRKLFFKENFY